MKPISALFILIFFANTSSLQSQNPMASINHNTTYTDPHSEGGTAHEKPDYSFYHSLLAIEQLTHHLRNNTQYPDIMVENAVEGIIIVKVKIDTLGKVRQAEVVKSPNAAFDKMILHAVADIKQIEFQQSRYEGKSVVYVPIKFTLN